MRLTILCALIGAVAGAQIPPTHYFFKQDAVHEIRLTFTQEDWWEQLTANYAGTEAVDNIYITASFESGPYKFDSVGVRFKGNSSYSAAGKKKPFRIKFNEFVKGQKIEGINAINLSNAWNDPSFIREKAYYEMAAGLGLVSPRSNFAALYINGVYWGLYVLDEVVNSDFLKNHYGRNEDTGNLYKGNIGATFGYLGEDKAVYKEVWEKQTNEEADDWADLIALCKLINDTPVEELRSKLEPVMDVDTVLAALALDNATVNLDSYVGMGQNFNVYKRPSDNRWVWIVWDPSLAFGAFSQGGSQGEITQLALEYVMEAGMGGGQGGEPPTQPGPGPAPPTTPPTTPPGPTQPGPPQPGPTQPGPTPPTQAGGGPAQGGRPLATKLWAVPEYKARYRQIYRQLVDKVFGAESVLARMTELRDMIRPYVEMDTQKLVTMEQFEQAMTAAGSSSGSGGGGQPGGPGGGGMSAPALKPFVEGRLAFVNEQLAQSDIPVMSLTPGVPSLSFAVEGDKDPSAQTVSLALDGTDLLTTFVLTTATESGGGWLSVAPATGIAGGSFKVSVKSAGLDNGVYLGSVTLRSPALAGDPISIPVSFTVAK